MPFLETKYSRRYDALVAAAQTAVARDYTERHHIVPRSLGGGNAPANIVRMTYRQHFLAHWLLTKITVGDDRVKMLFALSMMKKRSPYGRRIVAGWQYAIARRAGREASKDVVHTPERNAKISVALKGRVRSPEHSAAISKAKKGYRCRPETIAKRSATMTGRKQSEATRNKRSATMKARGPYPGLLENAAKGREAALIATRGIPKSADHRAKIAAAQSAAWARGRAASSKDSNGRFIKGGAS